jgi:hypothetical protein
MLCFGAIKLIVIHRTSRELGNNKGIIGTDTYFLEVKIIKKTISFGEHEF